MCNGISAFSASYIQEDANPQYSCDMAEMEAPNCYTKKCTLEHVLCNLIYHAIVQ